MRMSSKSLNPKASIIVAWMFGLNELGCDKKVKKISYVESKSVLLSFQ